MTWTVEPSNRNPVFAYRIVNEAGDMVALVQREEDARLIAAAPSLLDALRRVLEHAYELEDSDEIINAVADARIAIRSTE